MKSVIEFIIIVQHLPCNDDGHRTDSLVCPYMSEQEEKSTRAPFPVELRDLVDICEADPPHEVECVNELIFDRGPLVIGLHTRITT